MRERGKEVRVKKIINEKSFMSRYLVILGGVLSRARLSLKVDTLRSMG